MSPPTTPRSAGAAGSEPPGSRRSDPTDRAVPEVTPELPTHPWRVLLAVMQRLPQAALSRTFGQMADLRIPAPLRPMLLGGFARMVGIDLTEAERPLESYESINDLFVRRLRPGLRVWPADENAIASPVDGILGRCGTITEGRLVQAKGRTYSAGALLADERAAEWFDGGTFITLYLSPRHYHRIHSPVSGTIREARHVPGALLPVNAAGVMHLENLFPRNERVLCTIESAAGTVAVVAVGAYNVGRISTAFDPDWLAPDGRSVRNRFQNEVETRSYGTPIPISRGDELMAFHLGSTVVLLCTPGFRLRPDAEPGSEVRLGELLASA